MDSNQDFGSILNNFSGSSPTRAKQDSGEGVGSLLNTYETTSTRPTRSTPVDDAGIKGLAAQEGAEHLLPVIGALYGQESGSGATQRTSIDGARGGMQIMPATFQRYAKPGERIDNPEDNMRVGIRIVKDLATKFGDDPAKIATGYFSGEGNVNAGQGSAWREDRADGNGKRVSSYVADVLGRVTDAVVPSAKAATATTGPDLSKAPKWADVQGKPEFAKLSPEKQAEAKAAYFDYWIAPHAGDKAAGLRQQFLAKANENSNFLTDIGNLAGMGVNSMAQDVRELVGRIPGVGKTVVEKLDAIDKWATGKSSDELLKGNIKGEQERLTPEMQAAGDKKWWDSDKGTFGNAWSDPRSYVSGLVQSLPEQALTMVPSMALAKGIYAIKLAAGVAPEVAAAAAARAATIAGGVSEGALGGAQSSRQVRDKIMEMTPEQLQNSDALKALVSQGVPFEQARAQLANDSATQAFILAGITTGMFGGMGDRMMAKAITEGVGKNIAGRVAKGVVGEGLMEEFPQSYTQAVSENIAMRRADPSIGITDDALNQGLGGLAVGALQGGGMAAGFGHNKQQPAPAAQGAAPSVAPDAAPATASVTPDGRIEPTLNPDAEATVTPAEPVGAPAIHPTSQTADDIVRELATEAGIPHDTVLPTAATPAQGVESVSDSDVVGFAANRYQQLRQKRDGQIQSVVGEGGVVDQDMPGVGLSPAEQQELAGLERAKNDPKALRTLYGFGETIPSDQSQFQNQAQTPAPATGPVEQPVNGDLFPATTEPGLVAAQENQSETRDQQGQATGPALDQGAIVPTGQPSGPAAVQEPAAQAAAAQNDVGNAVGNPGQQDSTVQAGGAVNPQPTDPAKPQGQFASADEAKQYISQQRRASSTTLPRALPLPYPDGTFGIVTEGGDGWAEAQAYAKANAPKTEKQAKERRNGTQATQAEQAKAQGQEAPAAAQPAVNEQRAFKPTDTFEVQTENGPVQVEVSFAYPPDRFKQTYQKEGAIMNFKLSGPGVVDGMRNLVTGAPIQGATDPDSIRQAITEYLAQQAKMYKPAPKTEKEAKARKTAKRNEQNQNAGTTEGKAQADQATTATGTDAATDAQAAGVSDTGTQPAVEAAGVEPKTEKEAKAKRDAAAEMTQEQRRAAIDAETQETRTNVPQVAQPTATKTVTVTTQTLSGVKHVRAKLYEVPNYNGPQIAVQEYKTSRGQGYRVYLPKSGAFIHDNNGVGTLEDTIKLAVLRIQNARDTLAKAKNVSQKPAENDTSEKRVDETTGSLNDRWEAITEGTKTDGQDPDKGQRSYRAFTKLVGATGEKPMDVWNRWSSHIGSTELVNSTGDQVLKWMEGNLIQRAWQSHGLPGGNVSSAVNASVSYWERAKAEFERRQADFNKTDAAMDAQTFDVERLGGDAKKIAAARDALTEMRKEVAANGRAIDEGLKAAEAREAEEKAKSDAEEAAKFQPADMKELAKKPTPASVTGWLIADNNGADAWTNSHIIDFASEPHLKGWKDRTNPAREGLRPNAAKIIPKSKGEKLNIVGVYNGEYGGSNTAPKGLVYFDMDGKLIGVSRTYIQYFLSKFKGAEFYSESEKGPLSIYHDGKLVGLVMPVKMGDETLENVKAKVGANKPKTEKEAKAKREQKSAQEVEKKATTELKAEPASTSTITDFGEKIGGAKKDIWTGFKDKLNEVGDDQIASKKLSEIWPAPDYQGLIDGGMDKEAVAVIRTLRDEIPAKPRAPYKVKRWSEQVKLLRGFATKIVNGSVDAKKVREEVSFVSDRFKAMMARADLYMEVGHGKSLEGIRLAHHHYTLYRGRENVSLWVVERDSAATAFSNWPQELATGDTKEQAIAAFKAKYDSLDAQAAVKKASFDIFSERGKDGYFIGKKIGRNLATIEGPFATVKEAREYRTNHLAELEAKLEKYKEIPRERRDVNEPRVGEDMRNGQDVTPEMFAQTFGFRGVEFGNWVEQGRRQKDLNDAFDGLMDMAAILGIPAKAISLNGELGLAFGARGSGGKNSAAAHYEPGHVVINLTKMNGAGSLGHEWWHALDNYFAKQRKKDGSYMTTALDVSLASRGSNYQPYEGVRKEMIDAFGAVMRSIGQTAMKQRSGNLDAKRTKEYWGTGEELSARAFEAYLISKLQDQEASNDYLANIVDEKTWNAMAALGIENENSYPYPNESELPSIRAGFDQFFQTIEHEETDKGVRLFDFTRSPSLAFLNTPESVRVNARQKLEKLGKKLDAGKITESEFVLAAREITAKLNNQKEEREYRQATTGRRRGYDWVVAQLHRYVADEGIDREVASFANWMLDQNPNLANDLGIGITSKDNVAGDYNPASSVFRLVAGKANPGTAVHEILHHTERMMPVEVQDGVLREWKRAWETEFKAGDKKMQQALTDMLAASLGSKPAYDRVQAAFNDGTLVYDQHYQLFSPSEFWAVNASRIMSGRYAAKGSWVKRAVQWFKEFVQRVKGVFGLPSDAPILKALKAVLNGDGQFQTDAQMLVDRADEKTSHEGERTFNDFTRKTQNNLIQFFGNRDGQSLKTFGAYEKTLSTQYNKALKDKHFGKVFGYVNAMQNEVSLTSIRPAELAPGVLPRLDDVKSALATMVKGKPASGPLNHAAQAIFDGTLAGDSVLQGKVWTQAQFMARPGATEASWALYQQARAAIDASLDEVAAAEAYAMAQGFVAKAMRRQIIDNPGQAQGLIANDLKKQMRMLEVAIEKAKKLGAEDQQAELESALKSYQSTLDNIDKIFVTSKNLKVAGYAPLMRFGKFTVSVQQINPATGQVLRDENGESQTLFYKQYETEGEAKAVRRQMEAKYAGRDDVQVSAGTKSQTAHELYNGITPETLALFAEAIGADNAMRKYIELAMTERSALKRRLHRKGTEGYSDDLPRVLSNFITSNGRHAAQRYYLRDLNNAIKYIPKEKGDVLDEANRLKKFVMNPNDPGAPLSSAMFAWFLGGSVASAVVNLTQPVMMTAPYLTQFGVPQATKALATAMPYALGKKQITDAAMRDALKRASQEGIVDAQEIFHLYSVGAQGVAANLASALAKVPGVGGQIKAGSEDARARINAFLTLWGSMFAVAEGFNRKLTFIAAWEVAKANGEKNPYAFAVRAVNETQGIYNKVNRPNWGQGPVGRTLLTFKQYSIMYVELLTRMWKRGGPEGKRAALIMLAVLMLASGEEGLPFSQDLDDLIDTVGQFMGFDTNMRRNKRRLAHEVLGKTLGDLFLYGVSSYLPLDFSGRLGLGNLIPGTGLLKPSNEQGRAREVAEIFGPTAGMATQVSDAYDAVVEGNSGKAVQNLAPKAVKDALAAGEMAKKGYATDSRGRKVIDTTPGEAAIKGIGFNPTSVAQETRKTMPVQQDIALQKRTESSIVNQWVRGLADNDVEMAKDAQKRLDDWNRRNPGTPIQIKPDQIRSMARQMMTEKDARLIKSAPREMRGRVGLDLAK